MKYTVFYKPDGTVISTASEQEDINNIKIGIFEVKDGHIIDSIDTSKKEHIAVSHATPMTNAEELEAVRKQGELNAASIAELAEFVMTDGSET